jgi:hypothetical protein
MPGSATSEVEVTNISKHGLRLERPARGHLYWPDIDVDLSIDSIAPRALPAEVNTLSPPR